MSMGTSILGQQTVSGGKIDNLLPYPFVPASTPTDRGDTNGFAARISARIPAPKVKTPSPHTPLHKFLLTLGYRGESPFSANETKHVSKYISETLPSQHIQPKGYIDFDSYSQMILYPFAYDCDHLPRDAENLAEAAWVGAKAARGVHGRYFDVASACEGDNFAQSKQQ